MTATRVGLWRAFPSYTNTDCIKASCVFTFVVGRRNAQVHSLTNSTYDRGPYVCISISAVHPHMAGKSQHGSSVNSTASNGALSAQEMPKTLEQTRGNLEPLDSCAKQQHIL